MVRYFRAGILCLLFLAGSAVYGQTVAKQLANGITLIQTVERRGADSTPVRVIDILRVDTRSPGVRIVAALGKGQAYGTDKLKGRDTASGIAKRLNAAAVVNAGYFWGSADPLSLHISDGELVSEPIPNRVSFGITSDGRMLFDQVQFEGKVESSDGSSFPVRGIDRVRGKNELIVYTPTFCTSTCTASLGSEVVVKCGSAPVTPGMPMVANVSEVRTGCGDTRIVDGTIVLSGSGMAADFIDQHLKPETPITIRFDLKPARSAGWDKVVEAVSGGPWLVKDGVPYIDVEAENIKPDISRGQHARTAVGATADGKLVIATVGGWLRTGGMTLHELANLMLGQGCVNAINLDGGGSTTMATPTGVVNCPTDLNERYIADALAVLGDCETPSNAEPAARRVVDRGELASRSGMYEGKVREKKGVGKELAVPDFRVAVFSPQSATPSQAASDLPAGVPILPADSACPSQPVQAMQNTPSGAAQEASSQDPETIADPSDPAPDTVPNSAADSHPDTPHSAMPSVLASGTPHSVYRLQLVDASTGQPLSPGLVEQAVWSLAGGIGFVDQQGTLYAAKAGTGVVSVRIGAKLASFKVEVG